MSIWKNLYSRWRDAVMAARTVLQVRKQGINDPLAIIPEQELVEERVWLAQRDYENQLMQECIIGVTQGRSPCEWCEEHNEGCTRPERYKGCDGWWLRFLTEEEVKACEQRAAAGSDEKAAEAGARADENAAHECAHEEWYNAGGPESVV